ncbi:DNA-binding transcriptional regulator, MerR family [Lentzea fradiae]|uniref:DNA-binding transcriptional regulator, MerR family n=1 Tax=Lentzea fradiae TaxID=200378 RepID=A0A1G7SRG4_9PSEU|nr:MerR family transcriptional regulator [Lentzea fradiae]SDG25561.1 DNA-binding transcriptional regulator, MerR family [Lentzea fradiae]
MRIGELSKRTCVSVRALRYYEEQGLLVSERSASGQRRYGDDAVARVQFIQQLYAAGISSASIAEMLPCIATGVASPEVLARLHGHRASVVKQIEDLRATLRQLDRVMDGATRSAESGTPCPPRYHEQDGARPMAEASAGSRA